MPSHLQNQHTIVVLYYNHFGKENNCRIGLLLVHTSPFFPPKPEVIHMHDINITKIKSLRSMLKDS